MTVYVTAPAVIYTAPAPVFHHEVIVEVTQCVPQEEQIVVPVPQIRKVIAAAIQLVPQEGTQEAEQIVNIPVSQIKEERIVDMPVHDVSIALATTYTVPAPMHVHASPAHDVTYTVLAPGFGDV